MGTPPLAHLTQAQRLAPHEQGQRLTDILTPLTADDDTLAAAYLYPTVTEERLSLGRVARQVNEEIAHLIDSVMRFDRVAELHHQGQNNSEHLERLRKFLLALAVDGRAVIIKLAVQLDLMRRLRQLPSAMAQQIAEETRDLFAPLANRLGIGRLKWELEDLTLRHLNPIAYHSLAAALDERRCEREAYIEAAQIELQDALTTAGIPADLSGRVKHLYSIWKKMQRKNLSFDQVFDIRALRVTVETKEQCYAALGVVHGLWNHLHREFDDYIAHPKANGYQSLHTAVVGPKNKVIEVQIRTFDMHQKAELGVAAHWRYKEGGMQSAQYEQQIAKLRQLLESEGEDGFTDWQSEVLRERIFVITPKGDVIDLPQSATPLDFAYYIHTEIGHRCRGAKVNGRIVPLSYELQNSDRVEILTTKVSQPRRDWLSPHLNYLKTSRARAKVRSWFKQQNADQHLSQGRTVLEQAVHRLGVHKAVDWPSIAERLKFASAEELFIAVGSGDWLVNQVIHRIQDLILPDPPRAPLTPPLPVPNVDLDSIEVTVEGMGKMLTHRANCCQPTPNDPIRGFITVGRGVAIHHEDCVNLRHLAETHPDRMIGVSWGLPNKSRAAEVYRVQLRIVAHDRTGLLSDITSTLAHEKANVIAVNTKSDGHTRQATMALTVEIQDVGQLSRVLDKMGQLPEVIEAYRQT